MSVSDGHMGIESQRLPGQGMTGIGPDVVKPPRLRTRALVYDVLFHPRDVCVHSRLRGWETGSMVEQVLRPAMPGESFPGLGATARESVGQLLPNATPQSSAWRSHLARKPWTLGAASLKARCYDTRDAAPF